MSTRILSAALILVGGFAFCQDVATESKALSGTWQLTAGEIGGGPFPEAQLKITKLVIDGDKYTVTVGDKIDKGSVKLDLTKKPKAMDIIGNDGPNKGKTFLAIYELNGDKLRICYDLTGKERPKEFKTEKGVLHFLATYQRTK
jgi:uncharacterized protein (TIGR03067 family)